MSGADINVYNHGPDAIVSMQVNGYGGPRANPYGGGGGFCCVMVPERQAVSRQRKTAASTASPPGKIRICFIIDVSLQIQSDDLLICRDHSRDGMSGADINVYNHGPDAIVSMQVNGYGAGQNTDMLYH
jgi:hypothetical protein